VEIQDYPFLLHFAMEVSKVKGCEPFWIYLGLEEGRIPHLKTG